MGKNARTFVQDLMRGEGLTWTGAAVEFDHYRVKEGTRESTEVSGTSIFDPVLCELVYRWFPSHTAAAFESAGMRLYNEAILITAVGSLPIRIGKQFGRYRKLGKTHQNVLVFYNGDPKAIPDVLGECDFGGANETSEQE